jgi:hypothetical protein
MKTILLVIVLFLIGCTPVKYVIVDSKDSTKLVEVRKRIIYDDYYEHIPMFFGTNYYPFYNPIIIARNPIRIQPYRYTPQKYTRGRH